MAAVVTFEATRIPRFEGDITRRQIDSFCDQRTFWSAAQELLHAVTQTDEDEPILQVRYVSGGGGGRTRLLLQVRNVSPESEALRTLERALPGHYGWRRLDDGGALFDSSPSDQWRIARIERRLNFIDLPWRAVDTIGSTGVNPNAGQTSAWGPMVSSNRRLLTEQTSMGELEFERYCVPVSGAIEPDVRSLRVLFQELRVQAPCVVSFSLARADIARMDNYRRIAMLWGAYLRPFSAQMANAGFAQLQGLQAQYDRFLLPDRFLCLMAIQVATPSASAAHSIALHLTTRLGGQRSFLVRDPIAAPLDMLDDPWKDVPHRARWSESRWTTRRKRLLKDMEAEGIETGAYDDVFEEFLIELPHLYTIDEAPVVADLPIANEEGLPGLDARLVAPFSEPSQAGANVADGAGAERIRIGLAPNRQPAPDESVSFEHWHTISAVDLTKHAFVVGSTGSGKTMTTLFLVRELARLGTPFLIVEPVKTEYYDKLRHVPGLSLRRYRLEGTEAGDEVEDFLAFDPMRLQQGVSVARHASYLKSCFEAAFPLDPAAALVLEAGIRKYYTDDKARSGCGLSLFTRGGAAVHTVVRETRKRPGPAGNQASETIEERKVVHPSLNGFRIYFFKTFLPGALRARPGQGKLAEFVEQWTQMFERRFDAMDSSMIGVAARKADRLFLEDRNNYNPFSEMLSRPSVLELDGVPDEEHKSLLMAFVMTFLFELRQAGDLMARESRHADGGPEPPETLKHVLIVEEAHRILANPARGGRGDIAGAGAQAKSVSLFVDMLAEIRAFGQGLVIVEQIPTKIVPEAVKNTNLKIMLRLTAADDREFLGAAMNFSDEQKRFVTSLRAERGMGVDMVVFEQQLDQPRLLTLPLPAGSGGAVHARLFGDDSGSAEHE